MKTTHNLRLELSKIIQELLALEKKTAPYGQMSWQAHQERFRIMPNACIVSMVISLQKIT